MVQENLFISNSTIVQAFNELKSYNNEIIKEKSLLFSYFLLKGCDYDNLSFKELESLNDNSQKYCYMLAGLFTPYEKWPDKNDFKNPFTFNEIWRKGVDPNESLKKWSRSRLKNNITGGGTQWRKIIEISQDGKNIKFYYSYLDTILELTDCRKKINLPALAIWANRNTKFSKKATIAELCEGFLENFHINEQEKLKLFNSNNLINIEYSEEIYNAEDIRKKIGEPEGNEAWIITNPEDINKISLEEFSNYKTFYTELGGYQMPEITTDYVQKLLKNSKQIILTGPPGTSKSFFCEQLKQHYDYFKKVQFHPQYTYQEFIGGYSVNKEKIEFKNGIFLNFVIEAQNNPKKKYLFIIDEINRSNVSQVFGELISCLDRTYSIELKTEKENYDFKLPENLDIIATMNTTDRTLAPIDFALSRRFLKIYCPVSSNILLELCPSENFVSLKDFIEAINSKLLNITKNREMVIGHAYFLEESVRDQKEKYKWNFENFEILFNFKILPLIEEFCSNNLINIKNVIGEKLYKRLSGEDFILALKEYVEDGN